MAGVRTIYMEVMGRALAGWSLPVASGLLACFAISGFRPSEPGYDRLVAGYMIALASGMLALRAFVGARPVVDRRLVFLGMAFCVSIGLSTWLAPSLYQAVNRLHIYYAAVMLGVATYLWVPDDERLATLLERMLLVVALIHAWFVADVAFWAIASAKDADSGLRFPHFANPRHFAYYGYIAAASASMLYLASVRFRASAWIALSVALFGIMLTGARGAILAWGLALAIVILVDRRRVGIAIFASSAAIAAASAVTVLRELDAIRLVTLFDRVAAGPAEALYVADRLGLWKQAVAGIVASPWLGYGPEGYITSRCCAPQFAQPHNFALQVLLEFGILGFGLLVVTTVTVLHRVGGPVASIRSVTNDSSVLALAALLIGFMAYASIDGLLYHAIPLMHFAMLAPLLLGAMRASARTASGA